MNYAFEKFGVVIDLPNESIIFDKNEVFDVLKATNKQRECCVMIIARKANENMVFVNRLAEDVDKKTFADVVKEYTKSFISLSNTLEKEKLLTAGDGHFMKVQIFANEFEKTINIFLLVQGVMFQAVSSCKEMEPTLSFMFDVMKTITPIVK